MAAEPKIATRSDLWQLISDTPGDIAELGVAEGRFTYAMVEWPINHRTPHRRIYAVDRWATNPGQRGDGGYPQNWHNANLEQVFQLTLQFKPDITMLKGDTVEMTRWVPDESLALVYVDADHSTEGVTRDATSWWPKLVEGGVMAFHDYLNPDYGVREAVERFASGLEIHLIPETGIEDAGAWIRKP